MDYHKIIKFVKIQLIIGAGFVGLTLITSIFWAIFVNISNVYIDIGEDKIDMITEIIGKIYWILVDPYFFIR